MGSSARHTAVRAGLGSRQPLSCLRARMPAHLVTCDPRPRMLSRALLIGVVAVLGACTAESRVGTTPPPPNQPQLVVAPSVVNFQYALGGTAPAPVAVNVTGNGGNVTGLQVGTILYNPISSGWLSADYAGGASSTPTTIVLTPNPPPDLTPGTYVASVPVQSTVAGVQPQYVLATLTIDSIPVVELSPDTVLMAATVGGASPSAQTVQVVNGGGLTLSGLSVGTIGYSGAQSGWLTASLNQATAPATVTLQAATTALPAGTYVAQVPIRSSLAGVAPDTITVSVGVGALPTPPSIALSPSNLAMSATVGGANPSLQLVGISNGGGGTLSGLALGGITYVSGTGGWLTATVNGTTAPTTVNVQAATGLLAVGSYVADVRISSSLAGVASRTFRVTFTVGAGTSPPLINVAPSAIPLAATEGGASPAPATVAVSNGGGGALNLLALGTVTYTGAASGWLSTALSNTTAPATITLTPNTGALVAGTYSATVPVTSGVLGVTPTSIVVTLTVTSQTAAPLIALSPSDFNPNATVGGANPAPQVVGVNNAGGGTLNQLTVGPVNYTAGGATGWMSATLNQTTAPATVTLTTNITGLAAGTYRALIPVASPVATNSPRTIAVRLTVGSTPALTLTPSSVIFTATTGGSNPTPATVTAANSGTGTVSGLSVASVTYGAGQPTGWLAANLSGTTAPATLALTPTTSTLAAGNYTATVTVASTTAGVASKTVSVSLGVGAPSGGFVILQGNNQSGNVGTVLPVALKARLLDAASNPVPNVAAVWQVTNGGTLQNVVSTTNTLGEVTANWLVGPLAGIHTVTLSAPGVPPVTFFADVLLPGNPNAHPNEPPGYVAFAEHNLSSIPSAQRTLGGLLGQWYGPGTGTLNLSVVFPDLTAPESPPNVHRTRFPNGLKAGTGPTDWGGWDSQGLSATKSKIYFSMWLQIEGADFEQNNNGTKMGYFGYGRAVNTSAGNEGIIILEGQGSQHFIANSFKLHYYQGGHITPARIIYQNADTRKLMTVGVWHHIEVVNELNTLGQANGILKMWIDGIKILDYNDITYITTGNTAGFWSWRWNPTWGGGLGPKTRDDYMRMDHVYISGVP